MINIQKKAKKLICPVCSQHMPLLTEKVGLLRIVKKIKCGDYFYYKCGNCGHTVLDIPEDINLKYQSNYRSNAAMTGDIINNELSERYYSNRESILNRRVAKIDSFIEGKKGIFDIACGGGYVLNYYKKKEHMVTGIEIDDLCVNACRRLGIDCIKGGFLKTDIQDKYAVVMAWHILEHVLDINAFIRKTVDITNKNGLVIIEVPVDRGLIREWQLYNGHVHSFTKESLAKLIDKFNIKCLYSSDGIQKPAWLYVGEVQ
ncbi:class I SAM-dependent methyltransferase [Chloroflexota bacterium]